MKNGSKIVRILGLVLIAMLVLSAAACGGDNGPAPADVPEQNGGAAEYENGNDNGNGQEEPAEPETGGGDGAVTRPLITEDRDGNPITLPDSINTIISMGPANTEIIVALGLGDKIIAMDAFSAGIAGVNQEIPHFDMLNPDGEQLINLMPDVIFVPGMSRQGGAEDPFWLVSQAGITVIYIPSSTSLDAIMDDIRFIAAVLDADERAEAIISEMQGEIDRIRAIGETITDARTVYFEVSPAPHMVSFGSGTFLTEMIEIIGAVNILAADIYSWSSVSDEIILMLDPDVILTSTNFIDDPVGEIMSRSGWDAITAVRDGAVHFIDTDASNRPSHNVVSALLEMAYAVYPEESWRRG